MIENFTQRIKQLLGKSIRTSAAEDLLKDLGVTEVPQINPDSGTAHVERPELGVSLVLVEPPNIMNPVYSKLPKDVPILTTCFYYSQGHDGYTQFPGSLPGGIQFSNTREEIVAKLGEPIWKREKNGRKVAEKWEVEGQSIHVTYKRNQSGILVLSFGIVENF